MRMFEYCVPRWWGCACFDVHACDRWSCSTFLGNRGSLKEGYIQNQPFAERAGTANLREIGRCHPRDSGGGGPGTSNKALGSDVKQGVIKLGAPTSRGPRRVGRVVSWHRARKAVSTRVMVPKGSKRIRPSGRLERSLQHSEIRFRKIKEPTDDDRGAPT